jgi:hypothetical protein
MLFKEGYKKIKHNTRSSGNISSPFHLHASHRYLIASTHPTTRMKGTINALVGDESGGYRLAANVHISSGWSKTIENP